MMPTSVMQARWQLRNLQQKAGFGRQSGAVVDFPPADVFIETGYGNGETLADVVARRQFRKYVSIEVNPDLAAEGARKFAGLPHVQVVCGSSPEVLPSVCDISRSTVLWLDAHFSAHTYAPIEQDAQYGQCPLLAELAVIRSIRWAFVPILYIDDALVFEAESYDGTYAEGCDRAQFPRRAEIEAALPPHFALTLHDGRYYEAKYTRAPETFNPPKRWGRP